jgi:hypothetical protein
MGRKRFVENVYSHLVYLMNKLERHLELRDKYNDEQISMGEEYIGAIQKMRGMEIANIKQQLLEELQKV